MHFYINPEFIQYCSKWNQLIFLLIFMEPKGKQYLERLYGSHFHHAYLLQCKVTACVRRITFEGETGISKSKPVQIFRH